MVSRTARPTDLLALVLFARQGFRNEARTRRDFTQQSDRSTPLSALVRQWLFTGARRLTCVASEGSRIHGLASARRRSGQLAWEVDRLLLPVDQRCASLCTELLNQLVAEAGERGVQRVFLRLTEESDLFPPAQQAGFFPYKSETLFAMQRDDGPARTSASPDGWVVRSRAAADYLSLFRLYSAAVPASVREAEALTLQEWLANRDGADGSRYRRELVSLKDGLVQSWLQSVVVAGAQHMEVLSRPDDKAGLQALVEAALREPHGRPTVYWLVPDYLSAVQELLCAEGCAPVGRFRSLSKQLAVRARRPFLVPAGAGTL